MPREGLNRIFIAGATGVIGRRLCPLLVQDGWHVTGTTRYPEKSRDLREMGVDPVIVDVFDEGKLCDVVANAKPDIVIHQLTDLPPGLDPSRMEEGRIRNARVRDIGTRNLISASVACGVSRMVVQSIAFAYATGPTPYREDDMLGIKTLAEFEQQVINAPLTGIILRYGRLYGPGTGFDNPPNEAPLHVDAAADAARKAATHGVSGIYNIAEDDGTVLCEKAKQDLNWSSGFRC